MTKKLQVRNKLSSIGLEIDAHEFRAVQLMRTRNVDHVVAWAVFPRQEMIDSTQQTSLPDAEELRWAGSVLARRGFVGNKVSITPSTSVCSSHVIELPPADSGAPIDQLARMEIARERRCSPEDIEFGYWALPQRGKAQETLAVACPRSTVDSTLDLYEESGFVVTGLDLLELAVCRGGEARGQVADPADAQEINTHLHIGWTSSLAILTLGEKVIYVRRIEHGASQVWDVAMNRFQLSISGAEFVLTDESSEDDIASKHLVNQASWSGLAKTLSDELDIAIAYISHAHRMAPFGKIELSGYGATNPYINKSLDQVLGIPIQAAGPAALLCKIEPVERGWSIASRLSTAFGLAARYDQ